MKTKKPTKKELAQNVNKVIDKHDETYDTKEILIFFADFMNPERVLALAKELDLTLEEALNDISEESDGETFTYSNQEYLVLTDDEADTKNDESIDNYIDECILPEIPERYQFYFDDEKFKRDARMDGRGSNLAGYDGAEESQNVNDTTYYIYRTN